MEPDQRHRPLSDIYHAALEKPPAERDAFLTEACEGNDALRQEVESLLAYESASSEFLERPASAVVAGGLARADFVGRQLGPYTIVAPLGAGGMGEVYRARDSKLGRDVAIKILPSHFTDDPERRARFAREARTLATLNHPHIGAIYGLEEADGVTGIVLELVEGPTLADRLERGPLKIAAALVIARQIADALNEAHEHGIIHRDLKPANIVLQGKTDLSPGDVRVKVLDFGLAKPMTVDLAAGPTAAGSGSFDGTADGRILGTPAYMSPEQARGQTVDKRTDIWAFGCVFFEMLSGRRAFDGDTVTDTLASVLEHEPDWTALPHETPEVMRKLLRRCLQKDPRRRLHDIADASIQSDDDSSPNALGASAAIPSPAAQNRKREQYIWILTAALIMALFGIGLLAVAWFGLRNAQPVATDVVEFAIAPEAGSQFAGTAPEFAMSPDGRHVAFAAVRKSVQMLWVRSLSSRETRALPGTEGGRSPIWSPDSRSLAFFATRQLKRVDLSGGSPAVLCGAAFTIGGTSPAGAWSRNNMIVFGPIGGVLLQVEAQGGSPRPASVLKDGDGAHRFPSFLPDGQHFLYLAQTGVTDELRIGSLTSADLVSLGSFESHASYAAGHLFFVRGGKLMAQPFDADTRQLTGDPTLIVENAAVDPPWQRGMFSVSEAGRLVFSRTARTISQLTWLNRDGKRGTTVGDPGVFFNLDLNPDETHVAGSRLTAQPGTRPQLDIWLIDLARAGITWRLTDDPAWEFDPAWSPDGKLVAFNSNRPEPGKSPYALFVRPADSSGMDELLATRESSISTPDWSPGRRFIVFGASGPGTDGDLWILPMTGERKPLLFLKTPHNESSATFSPDGRWIAYESNASGRSEVYVRPFPVKEGVFLISRDGGWSPRWRGDGKELFFLSLDGILMSAVIDTATGLAAALPKPLFSTTLRPGNGRPYAVTRDGQRFLMPIPHQPAGGAELMVIVNSPAMLAR